MFMVLSLIMPIPGICKNFNVHVLRDDYHVSLLRYVNMKYTSLIGESGCANH